MPRLQFTRLALIGNKMDISSLYGAAFYTTERSPQSLKARIAVHGVQTTQ